MLFQDFSLTCDFHSIWVHDPGYHHR